MTKSDAQLTCRITLRLRLIRRATRLSAQPLYPQRKSLQRRPCAKRDYDFAHPKRRKAPSQYYDGGQRDGGGCGCDKTPRFTGAGCSGGVVDSLRKRTGVVISRLISRQMDCVRQVARAVEQKRGKAPADLCIKAGTSGCMRAAASRWNGWAAHTLPTYAFERETRLELSKAEKTFGTDI